MEAAGGLNQRDLSKTKLTVYLAVSGKRRMHVWIDKSEKWWKIKAKTDRDEQFFSKQKTVNFGLQLERFSQSASVFNRAGNENANANGRTVYFRWHLIITNNPKEHTSTHKFVLLWTHYKNVDPNIIGCFWF